MIPKLHIMYCKAKKHPHLIRLTMSHYKTKGIDSMAKRLFRSDIDKEWHEIDNRNWLEDSEEYDTVITEGELDVLVNDCYDNGVVDFVAEMPKPLQAMVKAWAKKHYFDYYNWK